MKGVSLRLGVIRQETCWLGMLANQAQVLGAAEVILSTRQSFCPPKGRNPDDILNITQVDRLQE